jgi:EAL domain-containing protein (putative c-di-GMP-specific phosphodiesterase class I)
VKAEGDPIEGEWYLEGLLPDGKSWIIPLAPMPFRIGRHADCHLRLSSNKISRFHAEIISEGGLLKVRDLKSTNGTFVNRKRVVRTAPLRSGDLLHVGDLAFRVSLRTAGGKEEETSTSLQLAEVFQDIFPAYEPQLRELIESRSVQCLFQPILRLQDRERVGYEIFGRSGRTGLPSNPGTLFRIAEGLGLGANLSRVFWEEGIRQGSSLPGHPTLYVNLHPAETFRPDLAETLRAVRELHPETPVTVEISEKAVTDLTLMKRLRDRLSELNVGLAYDDFGAGQARFLELIEVPPNVLKFDVSLIRGIHESPRRRLHLVRTLVRMAAEMGVASLAEGIECEEEGETCSQLGFRYGQGFHFGKPARIDVA